tara:strand:- start:320 stop:4522 length:4203 start_codon:yes stop_codon:yes gene_type:complete
MKNVKIILLLSVILSFFYFIKINEGFGPNDLLSFITGETDNPDDSVEEEVEEQNIQRLCPTSSSTSTEGRRKNTSLMDICSTHDSVKNLNDNIPDLPPATLVYPKDPVSITNSHFLPEDLNSGNTTISYNGQQISFLNILKDSSQNLQTWWNYDFHDLTETPEIDIKDSDDNEINTNIDLVYLSGCSQIITPDESSANNDNTPLYCHHNKDMNTCNLQEHCVWDALCEQPYRTEEHSNKIFTPKECILNGGIFRSDLLHYAKNTIVNDEISTSFNMKDITDLWFKTTNSQEAGQNDSDSCSFNPTNLQDSYLSQLTQSSEITDSYLDSSCYHPFFKRILGDTDDIDDSIGLESNSDRIKTTNNGAIFKSDNSYNNPMNLFDFRIDDPDCTWSQRMDTPENFAKCFNKDINYNNLPSMSDWSGYNCSKWSSDNPTDNCSTNTGNTRVDSEKIIENSNLLNDTLKDYCCLPPYTCTNIHGVDSNEQDVTQFSCPEGEKTILNVNADTCSDEGCSREECCVRNTTCSRYKDNNNIECSGDTFIKSRTYCFENDNQENLCDNFQDHCCEEHPMCISHYSSDEDCPGGYYFDSNARCSTQDCSVSDCCKIRATCSSFQCNTGYRLKDGITNCPTDERSCSNSVCCEPESTCSDMSDSITCPEHKILDDNKIYEEDNQDGNGGCCIDDEIICANPNGSGWEQRSVLRFDSSTDTLGHQCNPNPGFDEVWTYTNDIVDLKRRQHIQQLTLHPTPPRSNCGAEAEAESFQCPENSILDTYKSCSGDTCVIDNCCKTDTYFCNSRDSDVIYQDAGDPPDSISDNDPCLSDTLTNFVWKSCSTALRSIDLSSYPYIGNIYQACDVEPPSEQSDVGGASIPQQVNNPSQPRCPTDICQDGIVPKSNPPLICSSNPCTVDECCESDTCENYYLSNECPAGNKNDGVCNGICTSEDCCLPSNTINLSLQISDISHTLNTILDSMIIVPDPDPSKVYFTSDDEWSPYNTSNFSTLKYTPTDNTIVASSITDPNTDPDSNSIKFYVKGSNDVPDISNLVTQEAITGDGSRDILTFIVELNNLHFKSSASNNTPFGNLTVNCGDSNFQSSDIYLYKFLLYKEDNNLKLYTSSEQGQDISSFIESSTSPTGVEYDIGTINGSEITFDINSILTQISSNLSSPTPKSFEGILLKLLALRTDDIHDMFFGNTSATINIDIETFFGSTKMSTTITNENSPNGSSLEDKICKLDLDIDKTDSWRFNYGLISSYLSTYDFTTLTATPTPGIDNFVKYDNGLSFNTHFSVCDPQSFTISNIPSLIIRLKELILTGIDIYTLYNSEYTDDNFNKEPIGCSGSSTLSDGSIFTPDEITTINSFITDYGIDISNLQYTSSADTSSPDKIHYTSGGKNIDTIVLTIS